MKFCRHCGNQVADDATFCGVCGNQLTPSNGMDNSAGFGGPGVYGGQGGPDAFGGAGASGGNNALGGFMAVFNGEGSSTSGDVFSIAQGAVALVLMAATLFLPVVETSSYVSARTSFSFSTNMASLISSLGQLKDMMMSAMGISSASSSTSAVMFTDALNSLGIWLGILTILLVVGMAGGFITAARCLEGTTKTTLITGFLFVPYALVSLIVLMVAVGKINNLGNMSGSGSASIPSVEILHVTLWPWLLVILAVGCGVLGLMRLKKRPF